MIHQKGADSMARYGGPLVLPHEKQRKTDQQRERRQATRSVSSAVRATGITDQEIRNLEIAQDYRCAICGKHQRNGANRLHVDHDHTTGKVRGLLCYSCNTKLGFVEKYLFKIINYLGGTTC